MKIQSNSPKHFARNSTFCYLIVNFFHIVPCCINKLLSFFFCYFIGFLCDQQKVELYCEIVGK